MEAYEVGLVNDFMAKNYPGKDFTANGDWSMADQRTYVTVHFAGGRQGHWTKLVIDVDGDMNYSITETGAHWS